MSLQLGEKKIVMKLGKLSEDPHRSGPDLKTAKLDVQIEGALDGSHCSAESAKLVDGTLIGRRVSSVVLTSPFPPKAPPQWQLAAGSDLVQSCVANPFAEHGSS
ncbi:hypothetical protein SB861_25800 [Paraburkholderia sp. SIMBA_049]